MNKKIILSGLFPLVLVGGFLGFSVFRSKGSSDPVYKTETIVRGDLQDAVTATGVTDGSRTAAEGEGLTEGLRAVTGLESGPAPGKSSGPDSIRDMTRMLR